MEGKEWEPGTANDNFDKNELGKPLAEEPEPKPEESEPEVPQPEPTDPQEPEEWIDGEPPIQQ